MFRRLTHREWMVAEAIAFGMTEKEIALHLEIAMDTVKAHKRNIYEKTGCRNISDVTRWFFQQTSGITLEPDDRIKRWVSIFLLLLVGLAEFSDTEYMRVRINTKVRTAKTRVEPLRTKRIRKETYYLQIA